MYSGNTRNFFVGSIEGAKHDSEGAKIQKFAENGWFCTLILAIFFFWLGGGASGGAEAPTGGGQIPSCPPWCRHWLCIFTN